jgi:acylglycerol lipase
MITKNNLIEFNIINNTIKLNVITHNIDTVDKIMIHIHGLGSHFQSIYSCMNEVHERFNILASKNIKSYALELRGHGKSEGVRSHIDNFDDFISDLHTLIAEIRINYPSTPIYLLGESMGGAIAIKYCIIYPYVVSGIILLAPMCGMSKELEPPLYKVYSLIALSYLFPTWGIIQYKSDTSCKYQEYYENKIKNEYHYDAPLRLAIGRECYYTMKWLNENKHKCITPFIAFHSKTDMITNIENTKTFVAGCSVKNKQLVELEDGNHTLLVPLNKDDIQPYNIMMKIIDWIFNINNNKL